MSFSNSTSIVQSPHILCKLLCIITMQLVKFSFSYQTVELVKRFFPFFSLYSMKIKRRIIFSYINYYKNLLMMETWAIQCH